MTYGQIERFWREAEEGMKKPFAGHNAETGHIWYLLVTAGNTAVQAGYREEHARKLVSQFIGWTKGGK